MAKHISSNPSLSQSEQQVAQYLTTHLPDDYTIITNIIINDGRTSVEFDAVVLGRYAIYIRPLAKVNLM